MAASADHSAVVTDRGVRAACEYLAAERVADGVWRVHSAGRAEPHAVDPDAPACTCEDWQYRDDDLGDDGCKHIRRVRILRGDLDISPLVESGARINPILAKRLNLTETYQ